MPRGLALVIEDDAAVGDVIATVLSDLGVRCVLLPSPDAIPDDIRPDIVFTDLVMCEPLDETAVRRFLAGLRARFAGVPLVLVTAHDWSARHAALPVDTVLRKPFDLDELEAALLAPVGPLDAIA